MHETELPKAFDSIKAEAKWYDIWNKNGSFKPRPGKQKKAYTIIMPPPNVTGRLHMGHALDITTQDSLIRFKRMKGFETLFLPGMDHAGIATQSAVEKMLWQEKKLKRSDFTREEFLEKIWDWKKEFGDIILNQQKCMGVSCDWDYFLFTMDTESNEAVNKAFVQLYNEGLIYQRNYIVNWDTVLESAISDAEVEHVEVKGKFYTLEYQIKGEETKLLIATTRPETLLGDSGLAINPDDTRFAKHIGKTAIVPLCGREIPIIGDEYVDIEKGTGCLKVTPGHDFNDFEIGRRHNLEVINILNKDGTMNDLGLEWKGLKAVWARKKIVAKLDELNILKEVKDHVQQVGHGDRSKSIIEPLVTKQWFLNVKDMAASAVNMIENDTTKFWPKQWENTFFSWMREPKDWCLSRQLWWGHQIPIYYCNDCENQWAAETQASACTKCSSENIRQDTDVLDTWFSSGLWPMSTLGWPNRERMDAKKFDTFFKTSCLVTGHDIIFFWVARMMMFSLKFTGKVPFDDIYIHALVRDKQGRKLSKTLGNGVDPLEIVRDYGADAVRFMLASGSGYNRNLNFDLEKTTGYRNFINKIWNAFRFIAPFIEGNTQDSPDLNQLPLDHHEKWIVSELNNTTEIVNHNMEIYRFDNSCSAIYSFVYEKYCSWFVELSKPILYGSDEGLKAQRIVVLNSVLKSMLALLHPFSPYITEEIWSYVKSKNDALLIDTEYPEYSTDLVFSNDTDNMNKFCETVTAIRGLRISINLKPKDEINLLILIDDEILKSYFMAQTDNFSTMAKVKALTIAGRDNARPDKSVMCATTFAEIYIPLDGTVDLTEQIAKLNRDLAKTIKEYDKYNNKLSNEKFMSHAKAEVVAEVKVNQQELAQKVKSIRDSIDRLS